jgi:hypothetical protein
LPPRKIRDVPRMSSGAAPTDFRAEACLAQFRMRQPQIVDPLGLVVGELVGDREAEPIGHALVGDDVDAGHFRLLAAILGEGGRRERLARGDGGCAVALVEPLRLDALFARLRLAAFKPHPEHLHRIGQRFFGRLGRLLVHRIARCGRTEMRQAGTRQMQVRWIGVGDRRQHPPFGIGLFEIDRLGQTLGVDDLLEALATIRRFHRQCIDAFRVLDDARRFTRRPHRDCNRSVLLPDLGNQHVSILPDRVGFGHTFRLRKGNAPPRE